MITKDKLLTCALAMFVTGCDNNKDNDMSVSSEIPLVCEQNERWVQKIITVDKKKYSKIVCGNKTQEFGITTY